MSDFVDKCCFHCYEKVQTTREKEEDSPGKTMPCRHTEDVCQRCLQKVQTTTEDSPPPKPVVPPEKPKARQNSIFVDFYFLVIQGAMTYFAAKNFLKNILH